MVVLSELLSIYMGCKTTASYCYDYGYGGSMCMYDGRPSFCSGHGVMSVYFGGDMESLVLAD